MSKAHTLTQLTHNRCIFTGFRFMKLPYTTIYLCKFDRFIVATIADVFLQRTVIFFIKVFFPRFDHIKVHGPDHIAQMFFCTIGTIMIADGYIM